MVNPCMARSPTRKGSWGCKKQTHTHKNKNTPFASTHDYFDLFNLYRLVLTFLRFLPIPPISAKVAKTSWVPIGAPVASSQRTKQAWSTLKKSSFQKFLGCLDQQIGFGQGIDFSGASHQLQGPCKGSWCFPFHPLFESMLTATHKRHKYCQVTAADDRQLVSSVLFQPTLNKQKSDSTEARKFAYQKLLMYTLDRFKSLCEMV